MISVVVCSKSKELDSNFITNIQNTIGVPYELIVINNETNRYGLCEAYNKGATESKHENLVFVHQDVLFHSSQWGNVVINLLSDKSIGIVGSAGTVYKSHFPTSWIDVPSQYYRTSAIAGWKAGKQAHINRSDELPVADVALLDGMFLCMRKEVWNRFPFDNSNLKGFHLYDLDICLRVGAHFRNVVAFDILVEHLSAGSFNAQWFKETILFHERYKNELPAKTVTLSKAEEKKINYYSLLKCIQYFEKFKIKSSGLLNYIFKLFVYKPVSAYNVRLLSRYILKGFRL